MNQPHYCLYLDHYHCFHQPKKIQKKQIKVLYIYYILYTELDRKNL